MMAVLLMTASNLMYMINQVTTNKAANSPNNPLKHGDFHVVGGGAHLCSIFVDVMEVVVCSFKSKRMGIGHLGLNMQLSLRRLQEN